MKRNILFSTKAKFILTKALLLFIIVFVGIHLVLEQKDIHLALQNRDDLRNQDEALHITAEQLDDIVIRNAIATNDASSGARAGLANKLGDILEQIDQLEFIPDPELQAAKINLQKAEAVLALDNSTTEILKESFTYLSKARSDLQKLDKKIDARVEESRLNIRVLIENDPYNSFWILAISFLLILALLLITITEIFMPMQLITKHIFLASEDTENIFNYLIKKPSKGEVGLAQHALNRLFLHVAENIQAIKDTNSKAIQRLAAIEAIKDGVGMVDPDGILTYANRSLLMLHGISNEDKEKYIGQPWESLYSDKGRSEIKNHVFPFLYEKGYWIGESIILRKDNDTRYTEMSLTLLDDGSMIGTARDITRRKLAEKEQEKLQELFAQSQKMEAVGRLTGGVAHDFNNILTIISGNLDLIKQHDSLSGSAAEMFIAIAERAVTRGAELTQRLLSFSRKQVLLPRVTNINTILPETLILLSRATGELVDLQFDMAEELWNIKIDAGQMENALLNLVINARDAMPDGGTIKISTENAWMGGQTASVPFAMKPGPYVKLSVIDTGHGIPESVLPKVFDPFFTTKENGKGTGLGLSMVYGFAKQSGGYVLINSNSHGTEVGLYFPRHEGEEPEPLYIETVLTQHKSVHFETILVAEDEEDVLELSKNMLLGLGYHVLCASNGSEALKIIEGPQKIDLLLTDMVMPGDISGKDLIQRSRILRPTLKVMMVSGYASDPLPELSIDKNTKFLAKPYSQSKLATEISHLLNSNAVNLTEAT